MSEQGTRSRRWHEARYAKDAALTAVALDLEYLLRLQDFEVTAADQELADRYVRLLRHNLAEMRSAHAAMRDEHRKAKEPGLRVVE